VVCLFCPARLDECYGIAFQNENARADRSHNDPARASQRGSRGGICMTGRYLLMALFAASGPLARACYLLRAYSFE
jgi:hypothetical protein